MTVVIPVPSSVIPVPSPVIRVADTGLLYDDVMKVADIGFHPRGQCPLLSSQCPDTGIQIASNALGLVNMGFAL